MLRGSKIVDARDPEVVGNEDSCLLLKSDHGPVDIGPNVGKSDA